MEAPRHVLPFPSTLPTRPGRARRPLIHTPPRSAALLPLFNAASGYTRDKISSSVLASLATGTPLLVPQGFLDTYSFLQREHVLLMVGMGPKRLAVCAGRESPCTTRDAGGAVDGGPMHGGGPPSIARRPHPVPLWWRLCSLRHPRPGRSNCTAFFQPQEAGETEANAMARLSASNQFPAQLLERRGALAQLRASLTAQATAKFEGLFKAAEGKPRHPGKYPPTN
jgi:hypothetical protein